MPRRIVLFLALFFVALTSGAAFAIWLDTNPSGVAPVFYAEKMHAIRVYWSTNSSPSNWLEVGEKWSRFQTVRTILQAAALAFVILSTLFRRDISK